MFAHSVSCFVSSFCVSCSWKEIMTKFHISKTLLCVFHNFLRKINAWKILGKNTHNAKQPKFLEETTTTNRKTVGKTNKNKTQKNENKCIVDSSESRGSSRRLPPFVYVCVFDFLEFLSCFCFQNSGWNSCSVWFWFPFVQPKSFHRNMSNKKHWKLHGMCHEKCLPYRFFIQ